MVKNQEITEKYAIYNGDCIEVMKDIPDESIDLSIYSPPFIGLYNYSSHPSDVSNCHDYNVFLKHYGFVVSEISRLTKPGRISAVHCMDVPSRGANIGGYIDFPGDIIKLHAEYGFDYLPRICIWKEPLAVRNRTMAKALAHRQIVEDSTLTNCAGADYLLIFRKRGDNKVPVDHPTGLDSYCGERVIPHELQKWKGHTGKQTENKFSHWIWRQYASSFWDDIRIDNVLPFDMARDPEDEKHPHPLQLDVIERCVILYSNPGEIVLTPFMGVGSEVYGAVVNGRNGIGVELKESYYKQAKSNMAAAEQINSKKKELELPL